MDMKDWGFTHYSDGKVMYCWYCNKYWSVVAYRYHRRTCGSL